VRVAGQREAELGDQPQGVAATGAGGPRDELRIALGVRRRERECGVAVTGDHGRRECRGSRRETAWCRTVYACAVIIGRDGGLDEARRWVRHAQQMGRP